MAGSRWRRDGTLGSGGRAASPLAASLNGGSMKQGRGGLGTARPTAQKTKTPGTQSLVPGVLLNYLGSKFL